MTNDPNPSSGWNRVASELRAYREEQRQAWGDTDNALLGRYLADEVDSRERKQVEAALAEHPELRQLTDLVREVLADCETTPIGQPEKPAILPFAPRQAAVKPTSFRMKRRLGWLVAACLLAAVGTPLAGWLWLGNGHHPQETVSNYTPLDKSDEARKPPAPPPAEMKAKDLSVVADAARLQQRRAEFERWLHEGQAEMQRERFEAAAHAFNQAVATLEPDHDKKADVMPKAMYTPTAAPPQPASPSTLPDQTAKARLLANYAANMQNGQAALKEKRYDEAAQCYREALRYQPNDRLATVGVEKAKELAELSQRVAQKPAQTVAPQHIEEAVGSLHPFAASLLKGVRTLSEKAWPAADKKKERK